MTRRRLRSVAQAAVIALAVCAASVGGTDDDEDCTGDVECVIVVGTRVTCKGVCIDVTSFNEQRREEELRRRIERENRERLEVAMDRLRRAFADEMLVTGILFCVGKHPESGVPADILAKTTILIEDLPAGQLGEARSTPSGDYYQTVVDMGEARYVASRAGAPLVQVISETVLHEFIHHESPTWAEERVTDEANRRYLAMFGIPGPNNPDYDKDAAKNAKVPTC